MVRDGTRGGYRGGGNGPIAWTVPNQDVPTWFYNRSCKLVIVHLQLFIEHQATWDITFKTNATQFYTYSKVHILPSCGKERSNTLHVEAFIFTGFPIKDARFSKLKNTLFLLGADKEGKIIEYIEFKYFSNRASFMGNPVHHHRFWSPPPLPTPLDCIGILSCGHMNIWNLLRYMYRVFIKYCVF